MRTITLASLTAIGGACALMAGCSTASSPAAPTQAVITGTAEFRERLALPPNAVFEALLEDVSRADTRAVVLGQQNISPAGNPPYALNIPYNPSQITPGGRYNVRATIRVNDRVWFTSDQATPVLKTPQDNRAQVLMRRVGESEQPPAPQAMPKPGAQATATGQLVPKALQKHVWRVTHIEKQALGSKAKAPTLQFDAAETRISGNTSCNNYSATYTVQGAQLQVGPVAMTKMMCAQSHEKAFVAALNRVRSQQHSGKTLHLRDATGQTVLTATHP